jgi:hypothetical protein
MRGSNEHVLADILTAEERLAPDPDDVLRGVTRGIRRRRQRRRIGPAVTGVAAVLALAGGAVVVHDLRGGPAGQVGAPSATVPNGDWHRTVRLGWVPAGMTPGGWHVSEDGEGGGFHGTDEVYLRVDVSKPRSARTLPGWEATTVDGRPGLIVSRPTRTIIEWPLPSGHWVEVEFGRGRPGGANRQSAIRADAERIAAGISETAVEPVRVRFGLTRLDPGQRIVGVGVTDADDGHGTLYVSDGTPSAPPSMQEGATEDGIVTESPVPDPGVITVRYDRPTDPATLLRSATRIDDIQGRPAYLINQGQMLIVTGLPHGDLTVASNRPMVVDSANPPASESSQVDKLIALAERVRWTG